MKLTSVVSDDVESIINSVGKNTLLEKLSNKTLY